MLWLSIGQDQWRQSRSDLVGDGSGEILKLCAAAFTGPTSPANGAVPLAAADARRRAGITPGRGKLIVPDSNFRSHS